MYYDCTSNAEKNEVVRFFSATDGFSRFCPFLLPPKEVNWFYLKQIAACCCLDSGKRSCGQLGGGTIEAHLGFRGFSQGEIHPIFWNRSSNPRRWWLHPAGQQHGEPELSGPSSRVLGECLRNDYWNYRVAPHVTCKNCWKCLAIWLSSFLSDDFCHLCHWQFPNVGHCSQFRV